MSMEVIQSIRTKFLQLQPFLNERTRRLWAAAEAQQLGWGGTRAVELATSSAGSMIRRNAFAYRFFWNVLVKKSS